jgi:hypothetical protein
MCNSLSFVFYIQVTELFSQKQQFDIYTLIFDIFFFRLATLTRTIHGGNKPTVELLNNIDLLQQTWLATTDPSFPPEILLFDQQINSNMRYSIPKSLSDLNHRHKPRLHKKMSINTLAKDVSDFIFKYTGDRSYILGIIQVLLDQVFGHFGPIFPLCQHFLYYKLEKND